MMKEVDEPICGEPHSERLEGRKPSVSAETLERAAGLFAALGDPPRLRLLSLLAQGPACVSDLAADESEGISTISQRLKVLRNASLVRRRRRGKHIEYSLADQHVVDLVFSGLAHAGEGPSRTALEE